MPRRMEVKDESKVLRTGFSAGSDGGSRVVMTSILNLLLARLF